MNKPDPTLAEDIIKGLNWVIANQTHGVTYACEDMIKKCEQLKDLEITHRNLQKSYDVIVEQNKQQENI